MLPRLHFGRCGLRARERLLLIDGRPAPLGARAFDVLLALVERRDRVVGKAELLDLAWPGLIVEENNLSVQISALRKVLGAPAIATIPALGYRFVMAEAELEPDATPAGGRAVALPAPALINLQAQAATRLVAQPVLAHPAHPAEWADPAGRARQAALIGAFAQAAARTVQAHGGVLLAHAGALLVADFTSAHAAAACSHPLHQAAHAASADTNGGQWLVLKIGLIAATPAATPPAGGAHYAATGLADLADPGQTLAAGEIANQLVPPLDGDLQDLGEQHADPVDPPFRVFRLAPPADNPPLDGALPPASNLRPTLAVIPFAPYARQPEPISLGDILADQVIAALSRSHAINVISRLSTLAFRDRDLAVPQIARRLAADFVVSGRYWVASGRIHLQVELAEAASARVLWTETLVDAEGAVLLPDSQLVQALVGSTVQAVFAHEMGRVRGAALPDLASHTLLLAAISLLYRLSPRDFSLARSALETLHQRAPRHPAPLAWLARWHLFRVVQGWSDNRDEDGRLALDHANHALDLDPDSSLALTMLGNVHTNYLVDLNRAEQFYDQALALNPNESLAWLQKGNARSFAGDGAAALSLVQKATRLSPLDPSRHFYLSILASAALSARDYGRAVQAAHQALQLNHAHVSTHRVLAIALSMQGRLDEARTSVQQLLRLQPRLTVADFIARSPGALSGLAATFGQALLAAGLPSGRDA